MASTLLLMTAVSCKMDNSAIESTTTTGSISGRITLDNSLTGNSGFLVFVAGTSYMAMTDDAGNYTISGVPAGKGYQVVATKNGVIHNLSSNVKVTANDVTKLSSNNFTSKELDNTIKGNDGNSIIWLGSFTSSAEINNPSNLNAFFNTTDGCSYIYISNEWTYLAKSGTDGIVWKGELLTAPANPELNWAYYNTINCSSYIYNGESWNLLAKGNENRCLGAIVNGTTLTGWENPDGAIIIPSGVTCISERAFSNCKNLTCIIIPNSVTNIGKDAFNFCSNLTFINIPNSVTSINYQAFCYCERLTSITIPDSVTSIGESAFRGCSNLTAVTIGNNVTSISESAFLDCIRLTSVTIPDSVTNIEHAAFCNCSGLTGITIPDSVTSIGGGAFAGCSGLTSIAIPDSVTSIEEGAFSGCINLTTVTIPDSVTNIKNRAFSSCGNLTTVNYRGSAEQWAAISIGSDNNEYLTGATINYNYTGE